MGKRQVVVVKGLIIYKGKALIVKRSPNSKVGAGEWELVGGKLDIDEELEETLVREAKEETGLTIIPKSILYASTINDDPNRHLVFLHYLCYTESNVVQLSEEHTAYHWASLQDLKQMLRNPTLQDFENYNVFNVVDLR